MNAARICYLEVALCAALFVRVAASGADEKSPPSSFPNQTARATSSPLTLAQLRAEALQLSKSLTFHKYSGERFFMKFLYGGKPRGAFAISRRYPHSDVSVSLEVDGNTVMKFNTSYSQYWDQAVARASIDGKGDECILIQEEWGRTSSCRTRFHLLIPRRKAALEMEICVPWDVGSLPSCEASENFNQPDLKPYADYLNRLRYACGYCTEREILENPEPGWNDEEYCWIKYNADITSGIMRIQRAKGLDAYSTEGAIIIHDGPITYIGHPNGGGVFAEDRSSQEHYILYYPSRGWEGMTNMMKSGSRLFIEAANDGTIVVDTNTFSMRRLGLRYGKDESALSPDGARSIINEDDLARQEAIRLQRDQWTAMLRDAADAITSHQLSDGAIVMGGASGQSYSVIPYFANLAAFGLARAAEVTSDSRYLDGAQRWLTWYLDHRNADGTICDFHGAPGRWVSTGGFDSTDSYPATFLEVAELVEKRTQDAIWKARLRKAIPELLAAQQITLQPNGLTAAKPGYDMLFTMDNIEVYRGLMSAARIPDWEPPSGADPRAQAARTLEAITTLLFDSNVSPPRYRTGVNSRNSPSDAKDLAKWYPDQMTQLMAVAWLPRSESHRKLFDDLKWDYFNGLPAVIQTEEHLDRLVWGTMAAQNVPADATAKTLLGRIASHAPRKEIYNTALYGHLCRIYATAIEPES